MKHSREKPRIIMIISHFLPNEGGAERQMFRLSEALMRKGFSVMIVAGAYPEEVGVTKIGDIVIHRNRMWGIRDKRGNYRLASYTYMVTLFLFLLIHRKKYDIIHVHIAGHNAALCALASRILKKGLLVKVANSGEGSDLSMLKKAPLFGSIFLNQIKRADRIVAVNPIIKDELLMYGFNPEEIVEIPNGISPINVEVDARDRVRSSLNIRPSSRVAIFSGTFSEQKNIEVLIMAWREVVSEVGDALLIMLGDGQKYEYVKRASEKLKGIIVPGRVSDVNGYLSAADIFVLPSKYEGISNSLLEAMANGLTPVVSDISGNIKLISDDREIPLLKDSIKIFSSGIAVFEGEVRSLTKGLLVAIRDVNLSKNIGNNAKKRVTEHFNIDKVADRYIIQYNSIADGKRSNELNVRK